MLGKQIAKNLRQNRDKWMKYRYHAGGKYCVIGLKLHEMGVPVESWPDSTNEIIVGFLHPFTKGLLMGSRNLEELQKANDGAKTVDDIIAFCEENANIDYPLEALAEALKGEK